MLTPQQVEPFDWIHLSPQSIFGAEGCRARQYIGFASEDVAKSSDDRACVNAMGNAKRSLHVRIEDILDAVGGKLILRKYSSFPDRLSFCSRCGIASPPILRSLNRIRNDMEHEYTLPAIEMVRDHIDIVELFLEATNWLCNKFPAIMDLEGVAPADRVSIECQPRSGLIRVLSETASLSLHVSHEDEYVPWMQVLLEKGKH